MPFRKYPTPHPLTPLWIGLWWWFQRYKDDLTNAGKLYMSLQGVKQGRFRLDPHKSYDSFGTFEQTFEVAFTLSREWYIYCSKCKKNH
jgi:hypothetical protein